MKVMRRSEAERYEPEPDWQRTSLCCEPEISLEHFQKPPGHASPRHEHPSAQVLVVLDGGLSVETDDARSGLLGPGDAVFLPAGEPHVVRNPLSSPSRGLDIFVPGRSFDFWTRRGKGE